MTASEQSTRPNPSACVALRRIPVVETVSGRQHAMVLTPDPGSGQYPANQYTIRGCNFGSVQGNVQSTDHSSTTPVQCNSALTWDDNQILVTFNPKFQNEYDLSSKLTLAVVRTDGHNTKMPGVSFYATRVSRSLARIPQSLVKVPTTHFDVQRLREPGDGSGSAGVFAHSADPAASAVFWLYDRSGPAMWATATRRTACLTATRSTSASFGLDTRWIRTCKRSSENTTPTCPAMASHSGSCKYMDVLVSANMQGSNLLVGVQPAECDNYGKFIYAYYGLQAFRDRTQRRASRSLARQPAIAKGSKLRTLQ